MLGEVCAPEKSADLAVLLHLGAALRLLQWEEQGFVFHRQVGLPEAHQAIRDAMGSLKAADPTGFCVKEPGGAPIGRAPPVWKY